MSEVIICPFCGSQINPNSKRCINCNSFFEEPQLNMFKFKELSVFTAIDLITMGFFSTIWFFINGSAINNLVREKKDIIKLNWLILLLITNGCFYMFYFYEHQTFLILFSIIQCFIYIALTYRVLRIIQRYAKQTYEVNLAINPFYIIFFNVFYLVHFLDTYTKRVQGVHEYFDWKSAQGILLIILLLIILFLMRFYYEISRFVN